MHLVLHFVVNLFIDAWHRHDKSWADLLKYLRQVVDVRTIGERYSVLQIGVINVPRGNVRERQE